MKLLSIIVPVYNVKSYLKKCVESIINQTYTNLQIILVDDGSTDGSQDICDEFAQRDSRIVVIHKENGGLSTARNVGMDRAKGAYIAFVDSDDWLEPNMYEALISQLEKHEADIVACSFYECKGDEKKAVGDSKNIRVIDYMDEISADDLYKGLLAFGLFSNRMPPVFSSTSFFDYCVKNHPTFSNSDHDYG